MKNEKVVEARFLIIETSHRLGRVAVALGERILAERLLDEARRHARDLAPAMAVLLAEQGWTACKIDGVFVSRGPGSYTGLRVGIMSAKTLAFATGCALVAVDTFAAIALQAPPQALALDVLADAQQGKVYVQKFLRSTEKAPWNSQTSLEIMSLETWRNSYRADTWVSGPALEVYKSRLPGEIPCVPREDWLPRASSLLQLGLEKYYRGERDDPISLEPLYLRPSSAEEKWKIVGSP